MHWTSERCRDDMKCKKNFVKRSLARRLIWVDINEMDI
jgi:hypothetical protein